MKIIVGIASALLLLVSVAGASAQSLPGKYQVEGKNLDGSAYSGTAEIVATSEVTCRLGKPAAPPPKASACATARVFAAGYALGDSIGLVVYEMKPDGSLEGAWTIADQDGAGEEILTPIK